MKKILIILLLFLSPSIFSQDNIRLQRYRLSDKQFENENKSKNIRKRAMVDIDSNCVIEMTAWGDDCSFKIYLLSAMNIKYDSIKTTIKNGQPAVRVFAPKFRFQMYVDSLGAFEFDAIILKKSQKGLHGFEFDIETKGLDFHFQDTLMDWEKLDYCYRPDSVIYSYAVYHSSRIFNYDVGDKSYNYETGKAWQQYRIKAWDNAGDTVWGFQNINTETGKMRIWVDSTWAAHAVYPIRIDPYFGFSSVGSSFRVPSNNQLWAWQVHVDSTVGFSGAGTMDSMFLYGSRNNTGTSNYNLMALYDDDGVSPHPGPDNLLSIVPYADSFQFSGTVGVATVYQNALGGETVTSQTLWIAFVTSVNIDNRPRIYYDAMSPGEDRFVSAGSTTFGAWEDPESDQARTDSWARYSFWIKYTVSGGAEPVKHLKNVYLRDVEL